MKHGILSAWRYVASLPQVDVDALVSAGIRLALVDRDNTCVPRDTRALPSEVVNWFNRAKSAGLDLCLVSNNFHSREVAETAAELDVPVVDHAMKPFPFALRRAMREAGCPPEHAVMIGDQVFTDVAAGSLAGVRTVLVRPQSRRDLWYTQILRLFERPVLHGRAFEGEDASGAH